MRDVVKWALTAIVALTLLGCGEEASNSGDEQQQSTDPRFHQPASSPVGDNANVGFGESGVLSVTLTRVVDPAAPEGEDGEMLSEVPPPEGHRYVSLHYDVANPGPERYRGNLSGGTQLIASDGSTPEVADTSTGECADTSSLDFRLAVGARVSGCEFYALEDALDAEAFVISSVDRELARWDVTP